jgi:hypothetical protein
MQKIQFLDVANYLAGNVRDEERRRQIEEARRTDPRVARWFDRCSKPARGATPREPGAPAPDPGDAGATDPASPAPQLAGVLKALRRSLWVQLPAQAFPAQTPGPVTSVLPLKGGPRVVIRPDPVGPLPSFVLCFKDLPERLRPESLVLARPAQFERGEVMCRVDGPQPDQIGAAAGEPLPPLLSESMPLWRLHHSKRARRCTITSLLRRFGLEMTAAARPTRVATEVAGGAAVELFRCQNRVGVVVRVPGREAPLRHAWVRLCWRPDRTGEQREETAVFPFTYRDRRHLYGQHVFAVAPAALECATWRLETAAAGAWEVPRFDIAAVRKLGDRGLAVLPLTPCGDGYRATFDSEQQRALFADPWTCRLVRLSPAAGAPAPEDTPAAAAFFTGRGAAACAPPVAPVDTGGKATLGTPRFQPGERPLPGTQFQLVNLLGAGGFGEVWSARDATNPAAELVALKFFRDEAAPPPERRALLEHIAGHSQHPGIVPLRQAYLDTRPMCLQYDYVAGQNLRDWLHARPRPDVAEVTNLVRQAAEAVGAVHRRQLVHRDLKPSNLLVQPAGDGCVVRVLDFGTAALRPPAPVRVSPLGNPAYMSPEQLHGAPPDPRDDVFSLGVLLFQMLTGDLTNAPVPRPRLQQQLQERVALAPLLWLVSSCCAADARERPPNAGAVAEALERCRSALGARGQ